MKSPFGFETLGPIQPEYEPTDDLRHWPATPGGRMRDSLFWEMILPEEKLGMQVYLYVTSAGKTGYNAVVWGDEKEPLSLNLVSGSVPDSMDFDNFEFEGLRIKQPDLLRTCEVHFKRGNMELEYNFEAIHDPFSFKQSPDGLPPWFAINRMEQTGQVTGFLKVGDRRIDLNRKGNRDHSWGIRNWGVPHHWKWFIAYTESGRAANGWMWIAKGEWGFAGYIVEDNVTIPVVDFTHRAEYNPDMTQKRLVADIVDIRGTVTHVEMDVYGVVQLPTNDKLGTVIYEGACDASIDGEAGAGQFETHWQSEYLNHLISSNAYK